MRTNNVMINSIPILSAIGIALGVAGACLAMQGSSDMLAVLMLIPSIAALSIAALFRVRVLIDRQRYKALIDSLTKKGK